VSATVQYPWLLLLAPATLLLVFAAAHRGTRPLARWRRIASTAVRALAVLILTLSLVRPGMTLRAPLDSFTVFVADVSESVPPRAQEDVAERVRVVWHREIAAGYRCALVAFAGRAEVLVPASDRPLAVDPSRLAPRAALDRLKAASERGDASAGSKVEELERWMDAIGSGATDLARALSVARGLFREGASNRIVLLTDGRDTARRAPEIDLPLGTVAVRLEDPDWRDLAVAGVEAPLAVRAGEAFDVRVTLEASAPGKVAVSLSIDNESAPEARREVTVAPGRNVVVLENVQQKRSLAPGLRQIVVRADLPGDPEPRNNAGAAAVTVTGKPRVLLVQESPADGKAIASLLQEQDIEFDREMPSQLAARGGKFEEFVAVILAGVPREALSAQAVRALGTYVEGSGGGLWVVGAPALRGPRGYAGSEIEKLLPVSFVDASPDASQGPDPSAKPAPPQPNPGTGTPQRVLAPTLAILFVVDKSGSMAGNNIALVKEACLATAKTLTAKDLVGVLAFDVKPKWVLEFTDADRQSYIEDRVMRLFADGGTHIYPALVESLRAFKADPRARTASVKHAILLSDGDTLPADYETVVREMAQEGITVTSVCVGSAPKFDAPLMSQIAAWGKGRFFFTNSFRKVPQLFLDDVQSVLGPVRRAAGAAIRPQPPPPPPPAPLEPPKGGGSTLVPVVVRQPHEILQGIESRSLPPLHGKLGAAARDKVDVPLATPDGQPVLALWRVGLGKTAVWTSDLGGGWSADWMTWPGSAKLFAQLVRYVSSAAPDAELAARLRTTLEGARAVVRIDAGAPGETLTAIDVETRRPIPLTVEPDGGTSFSVPLERAGDMQRTLLQRPDGKQLLVGAVRAYDAEFAPRDPAHDLFAGGAVEPQGWPELERTLAGARMSGERRVDLSLWGILAVLVLLPLDVALRRFAA